MLAATVRRNITGRWNTMARRFGDAFARPPQVTRPAVGSIRPMARRISVVLPEPFGPISTVGAPDMKVSEMPSRIVTPGTP